MYVILDGNDNSCTVSEKLYESMCLQNKQGLDRIFSFRAGRNVGFAIDPAELKDKDTMFRPLQYNGQYKSIGFELASPTVNQILYLLNLPHDSLLKLSVRLRRTKGMIWYEIILPAT